MEIGIGLPASGEPAELVHWAQLAEDRGFSTLGFADRLVFSNYEPLLEMAFAAAATKRIRLTVGVLLTPYRTNNALLAKEIATLDRLSAGRLVLGVGLGGRSDDYTGSGLTTQGRGEKLDQQLEEMRRIWAGEPRGIAGPIGPQPLKVEGPALLVGGRSEAAIRRTVRFAGGWISGGGGAEAFAVVARAVEAAWQAAGKAGRPRLVAMETYGVGSAAEEAVTRRIMETYGMHPELAEARLKAAAAGERRILATIAAYRDAGCDELILGPSIPEVGQLEALASLGRQAGR